MIYIHLRNPVAPNMTFISTGQNFCTRGVEAVKMMLRRMMGNTPKTLVFTSSIRKTLEFKAYILQVRN